MMRVKHFFLLAGTAAIAVGMTGCGDASFAGPPQGSNTGGRGLEPLVGATVFTFEPELKSFTNFSVDHWFFNPSVDSNDGFNGQPVRWSDGIDTLKAANFHHFITDNQRFQTDQPQWSDINVQFPMTMSFMCQWFYRNADNSRPTIFDIFGREVYSDAALDISLITVQTVEFYDMAGNLIAVLSDSNYPNGGTAGGQASNLPLKGWTTPPAGDPSTFPPARQIYTASQFNTLGIILVQQVTAGQTGTGQGGPSSAQQSLGAAIADDQTNAYVETMLSVPKVNQAGQQIAVLTPVGVFGDNFALSIRVAPVKQPPQINPNLTPPRLSVSINDADLEEALIEFSRHLAALHTNLIGQAIGLSPTSPGTLMDPGFVQWANRYEYRFSQNDIDLLANKVLPGRFRDPASQ